LCDAPKEYGPPKTLYNRWKCWSEMGVFARIFEGLAAEAADQKAIMIDVTYLKAHRTASSMRGKKEGRCRPIGPNGFWEIADMTRTGSATP
jgi:transposase